MRKKKENKEVLKLIFWGIIAYLMWDWIGTKGVLFVALFLLFWNIVESGTKK